MIKPLRDLLLIRIEEKSEQTASGLFLAPEKWEKPRNVAEVLAVGPEVELKVGTTVVINPYAVIDTQVKEEKLIREKDILCLA